LSKYLDTLDHGVGDSTGDQEGHAASKDETERELHVGEKNDDLYWRGDCSEGER